MRETWTQEMKDAFEEMRKAEELLDDTDYMEQSPRYIRAMDAAAKFHAACDRQHFKKP